MEGYPDPEAEWTLEADKKLFDVLQQFSASFLTRLKEAQTAVSCLAKSAEDAETRANCAQAAFRQLANTHYIEQVSTLPALCFVFSCSVSQQPIYKMFFWPTDCWRPGESCATLPDTACVQPGSAVDACQL